MPPWRCDSSQSPIELPGLSSLSGGMTEVSLSLIEIPGLSCHPGSVTQLPGLSCHLGDVTEVSLRSNCQDPRVPPLWRNDCSQSPVEIPGLSCHPGGIIEVGLQSSHQELEATAEICRKKVSNRFPGSLLPLIQPSPVEKTCKKKKKKKS